MNIPATYSSPATGDIGLSCALNAVGVPPAATRQFQPVKSNTGNDFVRIYLGPTTIDGKRKTGDLMKAWRFGIESVLNHPADPFSALQVWTKTRSALIGWKKGQMVWLGTAGPWPCLTMTRDRDEWLTPGSAAEVRPWVGPGYEVDDAGLAAALIVAGVTFRGMDNSGNYIFDEDSLKQTLSVPECVAKWPQMIDDTDDPLAYFAAATQAREMTLEAIHAADPALYVKRMKASAWLSQGKLEDGDAKTVKLAQKIGL